MQHGPDCQPLLLPTIKELSTWFMRDGSFLRLKLVELGYTIPPKIVSKWGMSNLRTLYVFTNLFVLSKVQGLGCGIGR